MPSPFREAAAAHSAAVDEVYGETLRLRPQRAGGDLGAGGDDPSRPATDFVGAVTRRPNLIERRGLGARSGENAKVAGAAWQVSFSAALGLDVRAGDFVVWLEEPGQPVLRLAEPESIRGRVIHPADAVDPRKI